MLMLWGLGWGDGRNRRAWLSVRRTGHRLGVWERVTSFRWLVEVQIAAREVVERKPTDRDIRMRLSD